MKGEQSNAYKAGAAAAKGLVAKCMSDALEKLKAERLRIIQEAIGTASMCWTPNPSTEVFDSTRALSVAQNLYRDLGFGEIEYDALAAVRSERDELQKKVNDLLSKNLFERKQTLFLNAVQTWLTGACVQGVLTPCRAAEIQLQAACVPPSVLGALSIPPMDAEPPKGPAKFTDSMAWQACDFCKHYSEFNTWPAWTVAG